MIFVDGYAKSVISVRNKANGSHHNVPFPGPLIRATIGDKLNVTFYNDMHDDRMSIHFHGLHMKNNPWADGTDSISECGVAGGDSSSYVFDVTQTGTYWYHSHTGTQYADGLVGPFVLYYSDIRNDPVYKAFPYQPVKGDHVVFLQDWVHEESADLGIFYQGLRETFPTFNPYYPWPGKSILVNGRGSNDCLVYEKCTDIQIMFNMFNPPPDAVPFPQCLPGRSPLFGNRTTRNCVTRSFDPHLFSCTNSPEFPYVRLRIINGAFNSPIRFWVDQHNMTIVARDGVEVVPKEIKFVTVPVGQRIDVVLHCDAQKHAGKQFLMFATVAIGFIPPGAAYVSDQTGMAILQYPTENGTFTHVQKSLELQEELAGNFTIRYRNDRLSNVSIFDQSGHGRHASILGACRVEPLVGLSNRSGIWCNGSGLAFIGDLPCDGVFTLAIWFRKAVTRFIVTVLISRSFLEKFVIVGQ
jgi:hypothetical protein